MISPGCAPFAGCWNEEEGVPEHDRFNAGQKFVFWSMALLVPILFVTGIVIWDVYFSPYTTIGLQRIVVLVHCLTAVAAITPGARTTG